METRKESLSVMKLCRFCLSQDDTLCSIYDKNQGPRRSIPLSLKILSSVSVEVFPSDKMPSYICSRCKFFMGLCYDYKQVFREADESLLRFIQNGTALEPVSWPSSLTKVFRLGTKAGPKPTVMKTIVEGGGTIEVSQSQDASDTDDDEDVYNVKIDDGSHEGASACVKIVTSKDETKDNKNKKGFNSVSKLARHVRTHAGARPYPCKYCDKTFTKSHHYTRHVRLKHSDSSNNPKMSFGLTDGYQCDQCTSSFATQDELIYHSAIHATQNLTCPLCQEKFEDVDAVTTHIKSHVPDMEYQCDYCELVFTSENKLNLHNISNHAAELRDQEPVESSEMDADEEDESLNIKEEGDDMVIEIKKPDEFMIINPIQESQNIEDKLNSTNSEESESESSMPLPMKDPMGEDVDMEHAPAPSPAPAPLPTPAPIATVTVRPVAAATTAKAAMENAQNAVLLRKAEEIRRKNAETATPPEKKEKQKVESSTGGASDKSLRLLEKELQELQRTNTRNDASKTLSKPIESLRNRRPQMHTSTPKIRTIEEKKTQSITKSTSFEKKMPERRAVKENKKPEETKEVKSNSIAKEDKDIKEGKVKEDRESKSNLIKEETKEKVVKNGNNKSNSEEGVRRSSRPSKIKDYAKMIRDKPDPGDSDDETDYDDEEFNISKESEKNSEVRAKARKNSVKPKPPTPATTPKTTPARKRGRPRKEPPPEIPAKIRKDDSEDDSKISDKPADTEDSEKEDKTMDITGDKPTSDVTPLKPENVEKRVEKVLVAPTGQTLKKVPIKALPPGIKPLPLPANARPVAATETCEMQIGKKVVKVQKIVMTKAEVEAMAKKGLLEMKDGTMVLKQGIKLPTSDPVALKSTLVGEDVNESPVKSTPTRCSIGEP